MASSPLRLLLFALPLLLNACTTDIDPVGAEPLVLRGEGLVFDHATVLGMLDVANDGSLRQVDYCKGFGLSYEGSTALVEHRRGADGREATWDDDRFDSGTELASVPGLDEPDLRVLAQVAHDLGRVPVLVLEGVSFNQAQHDALLAFANLARLGELDAALDSRAAESVVAGRDYESVFDLVDRPWVGPANLERLRDAASAWALEGEGTAD